MPDAVELMKTIKRAAVEAVNATKPVQVCFGKVTSISPLQILVEQKLPLSKAQLILTRNVTDYAVEMTVDHTTENALDLDLSHSHSYTGETATFSGTTEDYGDPAHNHGYSHSHGYSGKTDDADSGDLSHNHEYKGRKKFTVHNGLVVGDEVILIRQQGGQKYIVLDRIGT